MPDNPYPAWKQKRCRGCAEGLLRNGPNEHLGRIYAVPCTAPTEAEYIGQLERDLHAARETAMAFAQKDLDSSAVARAKLARLEQQNARLCDCLNSAIRIVSEVPNIRSDVPRREQLEHWREQVKQAMALIAGAETKP